MPLTPGISVVAASLRANMTSWNARVTRARCRSSSAAQVSQSAEPHRQRDAFARQGVRGHGVRLRVGQHLQPVLEAPQE